MLRRVLVAALVVLSLASSATAGLPAAADTNKVVAAHKLIVAVRNVTPTAQKKLAVLVLIVQNGRAPAGAVVSSGKPLTILLANGGLYRVKAEVDSACKGSCAASSRVLGSADHRLEVVPRCRARGSGFVCSKVEIVKVY